MCNSNSFFVTENLTHCAIIAREDRPSLKNPFMSAVAILAASFLAASLNSFKFVGILWYGVDVMMTAMSNPFSGNFLEDYDGGLKATHTLFVDTHTSYVIFYTLTRVMLFIYSYSLKGAGFPELTLPERICLFTQPDILQS